MSNPDRDPLDHPGSPAAIASLSESWLNAWSDVPLEARPLLSASAVRNASRKALDRAKSQEGYFVLHLDKLPEVAALVAQSTRRRYPNLQVPAHSRWGHFKAAPHGIRMDRIERLDRDLARLGERETLNSKLDLTVVSVLLDAGAGMAWKYTEEDEFGFQVGRSEGLALATLAAFEDGAFSSDPTRPHQVDGMKLSRISARDLEAIFQVSPQNPLLGLEGRAALLRRLGNRLLQTRLGTTEVFRRARPSDLLELWENAQAPFSSSGASGTLGCSTISAEVILQSLLIAFEPIWGERPRLQGFSLGDCWAHERLGWVPFHKLSQWLTYSLLDPLQAAGTRIIDLEKLTGLPEYRNGGLFLDAGLLTFRNGAASPALPLETGLSVDHPAVIEWRALTVACLDLLAPLVCERLSVSALQFPLPKVLEGGTWWAGRELAAKLRPDGGPPFKIQSDGTVF